MNSSDVIRLIEELKEGLIRKRNHESVPETKYKFSRNWYIVEFEEPKPPPLLMACFCCLSCANARKGSKNTKNNMFFIYLKF